LALRADGSVLGTLKTPSRDSPSVLRGRAPSLRKATRERTSGIGAFGQLSPKRAFVAPSAPGGATVETDPGDAAMVKEGEQRVIVRRDRSRPVHTVVVRPVRARPAAARMVPG
jgi:hypothetical protein